MFSIRYTLYTLIGASAWHFDTILIGNDPIVELYILYKLQYPGLSMGNILQQRVNIRKRYYLNIVVVLDKNLIKMNNTYTEASSLFIGNM